MYRGRSDLLLAFVAAMLLVTPLIGCSGSDGLRPVSGIVTLDGQPVVGKGVINFRPATGHDGNSSGAELASDGRFSIPADKGLRPGKYAVTIQLWKDTGRTRTDPRSGEVFTIWEPIRFNEAGKLEADLTADGDHQFEFHLTNVQ